MTHMLLYFITCTFFSGAVLLIIRPCLDQKIVNVKLVNFVFCTFAFPTLSFFCDISVLTNQAIFSLMSSNGQQFLPTQHETDGKSNMPSWTKAVFCMPSLYYHYALSATNFS